SPLLSGVSFFEFHVRYDKGGSEMDFGIFQLGDYPVAEFDYFGDEFQAWCLVPAAKGDGELPRAVASAYGGSADFSQLCIPDPRKVTLTSHGYRSIAEPLGWHEMAWRIVWSRISVARSRTRTTATNLHVDSLSRRVAVKDPSVSLHWLSHCRSNLAGQVGTTMSAALPIGTLMHRLWAAP
ncbi:UVR8, partial [Symbiodinium microadriaticum]